MAKDLQNRDVFGYYVDKGWMCSGILCPPSVSSLNAMSIFFPYYNDPDEDFLTYVGQFYQENLIWFLMKC